MERRWKSWFLSRGSPEMAEIRRLTSDIKSKPDGLIGPSDSMAMGTNVCEEGRSEYFACFRTAASSAASPAITDVRWMYDGAQVWTLVMSQVIYLPADHGTNVEPSGRLPSLRRSPRGSFQLGMSAFHSVGWHDHLTVCRPTHGVLQGRLLLHIGTGVVRIA